MAKVISFEQLKKEYQHDNFFVEVTNRQNALNDIASKTSCCWGAGFKFGDSGWIKLASPSARMGQIRTVFVCKASLVA
jgi:hypothetical protein